jgi:hypothetical protein
VYRVVLRDLDGDDAGELQAATLAWGLGDVFTTGDGRKLRIVDQLPVPLEPDIRLGGVWMVEAAEKLGRPSRNGWRNAAR